MKFPYSKFGLTINPVGHHVVLKFKGRVLLGEVQDYYRNEVTCSTHLVVRHFNGDLWPIDPSFIAVDVLERVAEPATVQ